MKVSIIIPAYNAEATIADTVRSALAQTYGDFEIIVVDDGSVDGTDRAVRACYLPQHYHIPFQIIHQKNAGLATARNTGIRHASGAAILPLDADDMIRPNYLQETWHWLDDSRVGFVSTGMQYFGSSNIHIPIRPRTYDEQLMQNRVTVCSLIRKSALDAVGGYDPAMTWGWEDWILWLDLLKAGWQMRIVDQPLFLYRVREDSMASRCWDHRQELVAAARRRHPRFEGNK